MASEFFTDGIALIRACRMDRNCPLKGFSLHGSTFTFKIQQKDLNLDVTIKEGAQYPCATTVITSSSTRSTTNQTDFCLPEFARRLATKLGYTMPPIMTAVKGTASVHTLPEPKPENKYRQSVREYVDNFEFKHTIDVNFQFMSQPSSTENIAIRRILEKDANLKSYFHTKEVAFLNSEDYEFVTSKGKPMIIGSRNSRNSFARQRKKEQPARCDEGREKL